TPVLCLDHQTAFHQDRVLIVIKDRGQTPSVRTGPAQPIPCSDVPSDTTRFQITNGSGGGLQATLEMLLGGLQHLLMLAQFFFATAIFCTLTRGSRRFGYR